jgi:hypothetical protein
MKKDEEVEKKRQMQRAKLCSLHCENDVNGQQGFANH